MPIEHVQRGKLITAEKQNALIDQVNTNTEAIANISAPGGDLGVVQDLIDESMDSHVGASAPHPAYDDIPSLTDLFENGLV
jgi:hypothetical protein